MLPEQLNDFFASGHDFQSTLSLDDQRGSRTGKGQHLFQVLHLQVFQAVLQDFRTQAQKVSPAPVFSTAGTLNTCTRHRIP